MTTKKKNETNKTSKANDNAAQLTGIGRTLSIKVKAAPIACLPRMYDDGNIVPVDKDGVECDASEAVKGRVQTVVKEYPVKEAVILALVALAGKPLTKGAEDGSEPGTLCYLTRKVADIAKVDCRSERNTNKYATYLQRDGVLIRRKKAILPDADKAKVTDDKPGQTMYCVPTAAGIKTIEGIPAAIVAACKKALGK